MNFTHLDPRSTQWLARFQGRAPNLVSLALAALIAVELARIVLPLVAGPVRSPQPVPARVAPARARPVVDVQRVVMAHLFGVPKVEAVVQDPANAPLSSANLVLAGTIATQDPKRGMAIISDGGPSKVYVVGDNVGGASLHSVYLDHVILDRAGALETLQLPRQIAASAPPAPVRRPAGADPRTAAAVDNIRRLVQQDPGILDQVMRTTPSYDNVAGKLRGFRAYPGRNRAVFSRLGLKPGDLVTAINGTPLDDPQRSQEVFNTIQTSDHVTVTVERAGQKQDISLNIANVAAQATRDLDGENSPGSSVPNGMTPGMPMPPPGGENPNDQ